MYVWLPLPTGTSRNSTAEQLWFCSWSGSPSTNALTKPSQPGAVPTVCSWNSLPYFAACSFSFLGLRITSSTVQSSRRSRIEIVGVDSGGAFVRFRSHRLASLRRTLQGQVESELSDFKAWFLLNFTVFYFGSRLHKIVKSRGSSNLRQSFARLLQIPPFGLVMAGLLK